MLRLPFFASARVFSVAGSVLLGAALLCGFDTAFADEVAGGSPAAAVLAQEGLSNPEAEDEAAGKLSGEDGEVDRQSGGGAQDDRESAGADEGSSGESTDVDPPQQYAPGWNKLEGATYYADSQGAPVTGWLDLGGARYYFDPAAGGAMVRGFADIKGSRYCFGADGALERGWIKESGAWYHASKSGALDEGWLKLGSTWYYLDPEVDGAMKTGSYKVGNQMYRSRGDGSLVTGDGWVRVEGAWFWAAPSGALKTGWLKRGSTWYFLDKASGVMRTGWYLDGKTWYYSDGSGAMRSGGWFKQGSTWYYLQGSGAMKTGWLKLGSTWYFLDRESGAMRTGWYLDGKTWYYSDGSGAMRSGGWFKQGPTWYYLDGSGAMHTGWLQLGSTRYYLDPTSGAMATGARDIDGSRYWFLSSGAMQSGCWKNLGGNACGYIGSTGAVAFRGVYDASGRILAEDGATGWVSIEGRKFYFDPAQGGALHKGWLSIDGAWYFADGEGAMQTGWVKTGGRWYYLEASGAMKTGWLKQGSTWYYLDPQAGGAMRFGGWSWVGSVDYKFASNGRMVGAWVDVPCLNQYPQLPDGCESVALTNLLRYYGYRPSKTTIASSYLARSGSNFVTAYAGDPFGSGGSYQACAAPAIVNAGNLYLGNAGGKHRVVEATGMSQGSIYARLSEGTPVQVWNTVNAAPLGPCMAQQSHGGRTYSLYQGNHAVVVKGYDEERGIVYVADSIAGNVERNASAFFSIYRQMGSQAVMVQAA